MASGFQNIGKIPELRRRILFTLTLLAVYRIGAFVTTPGVNRAIMAKIVNQASGTFLGLFNMFSGGALEQMSIFALGIMPYISASIILQLLTVVIPKLEQIQKEGEIGRRRLNQYTRYGCVLLSVIQSFFIARGQRRIPVQYAKRVVGRKQFGGQSTHLPLKVNTAGVIPPIFASSILMFPQQIAQFAKSEWLKNFASALHPGDWRYNVLYIGLIVFFAYFYTAVTFNPVDVADNMRKYGGFIPGIRPGKATAAYIDRVLTRITFGGALYVSVICV